jgi:hypothetical protein
MKRKIEERIFSVPVRDVARQMTCRIVAFVKNTGLLEQAVRVATPSTRNRLAANCGERRQRFLEVIGFESGLAWNPVLPHMVSKFMIAGDNLSERLRIKLADPTWSEDGSLDGVRVEKFDQTPDSDTPAKLALCQLQCGFVQDASKQHRVEIGSEVYGYLGSIGPLQIVDKFVALPICDPF